MAQNLNVFRPICCIRKTYNVVQTYLPHRVLSSATKHRSVCYIHSVQVISWLNICHTMYQPQAELFCWGLISATQCTQYLFYRNVQITPYFISSFVICNITSHCTYECNVILPWLTQNDRKKVCSLHLHYIYKLNGIWVCFYNMTQSN